MEIFRLAILLFVLAIGLFAIEPDLILPAARFMRRSTRWAFRFAAALFLIGYCLATPALAQAAAASTTLNISQAAWNEINTLIVGIVVAVLGLFGKWVLAHSKLQNAQANQLITTAYQDLLDKGAQYGMTQLQGAETEIGSIDVKNAGVAAAANFVIAHGPDLAKKAGVDITTDEGRAAVIRSVTLRLGNLSNNNVVSPAPAQIPLPSSVSLVGDPVAPTAKAAGK